jgi:hypothetical protein
MAKSAVTDFADSYAVDDRKLHPTLHRCSSMNARLGSCAFQLVARLSTSARAGSIYRIDQGISVDSVIAVNSGLLPDFVCGTSDG